VKSVANATAHNQPANDASPKDFNAKDIQRNFVLRAWLPGASGKVGQFLLWATAFLGLSLQMILQQPENSAFKQGLPLH
jgi:hypothetical protein